MPDNDIIAIDPTPPAKLGPQNMVELGQLAAKVAMTDMFGRYTQAQCFLIMSQGLELGLSPIQSMRELNLINGKVDVPPSVRAARICASPKVTVWDVDADGERCVITAERRDRKGSCTVTVRADDLPRADVAKHSGHIEDLLYARAVRRISRRMFPDLALGIETWEPDENVIDVRAVEKEAGELDLHHCPECGTGVMDLQANAKGGAFLRCRECNATIPPTDAERDVIRGRSEELSVAAVTEQREPEGENAQWALTAEEEAQLNGEHDERHTADL